MRAAVVRTSDDLITDVIVYDPERQGADRWRPPAGYRVEVDPDGVAMIGLKCVQGKFEVPPPADQQTLTEVRSEAAAAVDRAAEAARLAWITGGSGQAMVYEAKRHELLAFEAAGTPVPADYPFMKGRAARLAGVRLGDVTLAHMTPIAAEWRVKVDTWTAAGATIEDIREQAKENIDAATDVAAIRIIATGLDWPAP